MSTGSDLRTIEDLCRLKARMQAVVDALEVAEHELSVMTLGHRGISDGMMARMGDAWVETGQGARRARGMMREIDKEMKEMESRVVMRKKIDGMMRKA